MLFDDDIVLCSIIIEKVENKLEEWRRAMEDRGLKGVPGCCRDRQ